MILFKSVNRDNLGQVLDLQLIPPNDFVAPNVFSLAQSYVLYDSARPLAIYNDDEVVGFIMFRFDEEAWLWRMMIDAKRQGRGYGKQAALLAVEMTKSMGKYNRLSLSYITGNNRARDMFLSIGFQDTGQRVGEENLMIYQL